MSETKSKSIQIRVSQVEYDLLLKEVEKHGFKSVSEYIRFKTFRSGNDDLILKRLETIEDKLD